MYRNLKAEMAREGFTMVDLAKHLKLRYATVNEKMNGKYRFYYDEALQIKTHFFPNLNLEYLFEKEKPQQSEKEGHLHDIGSIG